MKFIKLSRCNVIGDNSLYINAGTITCLEPHAGDPGNRTEVHVVGGSKYWLVAESAIEIKKLITDSEKTGYTAY